MQRHQGFQKRECLRDGYVSIGNFDGVHLGHQLMLKTLVEQASSQNVPSVVLTFDPHPITLLRPSQAPPLLTTMSARQDLFEAMGVQHTIVYPTDQAFLDLEPDEFFTQIVCTELRARGLVEGPNFFYGKDRSGSVETLRRASEKRGIAFTAIPPVKIEGRLVSSSTIRELLLQGNVSTAASLLGRPYGVVGTVGHGAARGRTIGFPTANLQGVLTLLPRDGVYVAQVRIGGRLMRAAVNLGPNPTFHEDQQKFEVHILDFSGDLYGTSFTVEFLDRIRDTQSFESLEGLLAQLQRDISFVREWR